MHLDARKEGVEVPSYLADNSALTLKISYLFQGETTHDEKEITTYLRFGGDYCKCVIPWDAIWGITASSQENQIWPEDLPREVVVQLARDKVATFTKKMFSRFGKKDSEEQDAPTAPAKDDSDSGASPTRKRKPTLTRIK